MIVPSNSGWGFVISCGWHTTETAWGPLTVDLADADTVETTLWAKDQSVAACLHPLDTEQNAIIGCVCVCVCTVWETETEAWWYGGLYVSVIKSVYISSVAQCEGQTLLHP